MKKIFLVGSLVIAFIAVVAVYAAFNFGEKSMIYVSGEVPVSEEYRTKLPNINTLFVVIYDQESGMPMPYGAMKLPLRKAPTAGESIPFFVTKERLMIMRENSPLPQKMRVKVRLDLDGSAGPDRPGDLVGETRDVILGTQGVSIPITKYVAE